MTTLVENTTIRKENYFVFHKSCKKKNIQFSYKKQTFRLYYENSYQLNNESYTLVHLYFSDVSGGTKAMTIRYQYSFRMGNGDMKRIQCGFINFPIYNGVRRYGGHCLIDEKLLLDESNGFMTCDSITICCEIEEIQEISRIKILNKNDNNLYQKQFEKLLKSGIFSDVILVVGETALYAHKNILSARSKVFEAMFEHDCEENRNNRVEIIDMSLDVCEQFLGYMYSGKNPQMEEYALELFIVADKYQMVLLKSTCEYYLKNHISIKTVSNVTVFANMLGSEDLETKCIDFITENSRKVKCTDGWKFLESKPELLGKLFANISTKYERLNDPVTHKNSGKSDPTILENDDRMLSDLYQMKKDYRTLLKNRKLSDAVLLVGKKEIPVHKNILSARSKVFAKLFAKQNRVNVARGISVEECDAMLRHIYTGDTYGDFDLSIEFKHGLLKASTEYQLDQLKSDCEEALFTTINVQSVVARFRLAEENDAKFLKNKCLEFIANNTRQVIQTPGWKNFTKEKSELAIQVLEEIASNKW